MDWLRYHFYPEKLEELPPNWDEVFGRSAPIWVEIGFGNGEFLLHLAQNHPEVNLVGFELSITSFVKAQKKFHSAGVDNVRLVMVDGRFGLRELFKDDSVGRVFVNFPCPWSKKGYEDRRITTDDFIKTLAAVLKKDGVFELMTDDEKYSREVFEKLEVSGFFDVEPIRMDHRREVQTRYERKWLAMGRHTYLVVARKIEGTEVERLTWEGGEVHEKVEAVDTGKLKDLLGKVFKDEKRGRVFTVKGVFSSDDGKHHLLKVISSDHGFEQHYNVLVQKRGNFWIVKLDSTCQPYRTPAVKWSIRMIAREITGK